MKDVSDGLLEGVLLLLCGCYPSLLVEFMEGGEAVVDVSDEVESVKPVRAELKVSSVLGLNVVLDEFGGGGNWGAQG